MTQGGQDPAITPELLLELYECTLQPCQQWPVFLARLASALNADSVAMRVIGVQEPTLHQSFVHGLNKPSYPELIRNDPFRDSVLNVPMGHVLCNHDMYTDDQFENTLHYQYYFRDENKFYAMGCIVSCEDDKALQIGLHRARGKGNFNLTERSCLTRLTPHLRQAANIQRLLTKINNLMHQSLQCLDGLSCGVWLLEPDLRCQWMNSAARELIDLGALGLAIRHGRLQIGHGKSNLQGQLQAFLSGSGPDTQTLRLSNSGAALVLCRNARVGDVPLLGVGESGMMAYLINPDKPPRLDPQTLYSLYCLTPAEIRLVQEMVHGRSMIECADQLHISPHTARTHLKSILSKTGSHRQAELIQKLMLNTVVQP